jgi:hypothetical protein
MAFVVCQALGLETGTASQDYIQLYHGDAELLQERLAVFLPKTINPESVRSYRSVQFV